MRTLKPLFLSLLLCVGLCLAEPSVDVQVLEMGMGPEIKAGYGAVVAYRLELKDGTLVEQADIRNPYRFVLGSTGIIPGLNQGVEGMKVGEKRLLTIPPELGYGEKDLGLIPPNSDLVFEVELLEISEEATAGDEVSLSEQFQDLEVLTRRHASTIEKPAMFEYLIRDFFTKPWRYADGHLKIWRSTGKVGLVLFLSCGLALFGRRRGWWLL